MQPYHKNSLASTIKQASPKAAPRAEFSPEELEKLRKFSEVLLMTIKLSAMATMIVVAPNALQCLDLFEKKRGRTLKHEQKIRKVTKSFYYLKKKNYIRFRKKGQGFEIKLTKFGRKQARKIEFDTLQIQKPKRWDGHFWQIAADIPTKKFKRAADVFRLKIREMGLYPLQRTLWYYPFDPRIEIEFVARMFGIDSFVTYMKIAKFDPEDYQTLKRHFQAEKTI